MAKEIEINLEEENNVSMEVKDTRNVEIGMKSDFGGTTDYNKLKNKPSINDVTLEGNKTLEELGIINYDDTEIKENITEIEKENTYQNKRLEYLERNQIQGEVKGEDTITITDGAFAYANILKETEIEVEGEKKKAYIVGLPQGVSRQEQREGYNKLNFKKWINSGIAVKNGTLNNYNEKEITLTTTENDCFIDTLSDSSVPSYNQEIIEKYGSPINKTQYSLSCLKNNNSNSRLIVTFFDEAYNYLGIKESQATNLRHIFNFDVLENTKYITYRFGLLNNDVGTQVTFSEMMLLEGTYTEETLPAYEQYGETPSIELESPIENVKAWNSINNVAQSTSNNGIAFTVNEDKSITLNGTATAQAFICLTNSTNNINSYENKVLTLKDKYYVNPLGNNNLSYDIRDTSGTYKTLANSIGQDIGLIYINVVQGATFNDYTIYPMLINGSSESKPYAPYGVIPFKLQNKNLFDKNKAVEGRIESTTNSLNFGNIIFSTATNTSDFIPVKKGDKLILTFDYETLLSENTRNYLLYDEGKKPLENYADLIYNVTEKKAIFNIDVNGFFRFSYDKNCYNIQIENNIETNYVEHQEQNYNLHIKDLELNGIGDIRDSFVVEVDNSYSHKKVKKLYKKEMYNETILDGINKNFPIKYGTTSNNLFITNIFLTNIKKPTSNSKEIPILCNYFKSTYTDNLYSNDIKGISIRADAAFSVGFGLDSPINTVELANAKLKELNTQGNPLKILYPLETPQLIDLTETYPELVQDIENIINNMFTYEEVTHIDTPIGYLELTYTKSNKLIIKNYDDRISALEQAILNVGGN